MNALARFTLVVTTTLLAGSPRVSGQDLEPIRRRLPPEGIEISDADRRRLQDAVDELAKCFESARKHAKAPEFDALLPDAEIYLKAVSYALDHGEFYDQPEVPRALELLATARRRLDQILSGNCPWAEQRGLVVRGYRSELDGSAQPYGLVIPEGLDLRRPVPLYVWLHGRGEKVTDLNFIDQRETSAGTIAPREGIVLHPFGRYCNAYKFAGEVDVFEAIRSVKSRYPIDPDRVVLWGFSMGGAGAWHLGAHHPDVWAAVSPGAGFAETARYQNLKPEDYPPLYEQALWNLYDVPSYVRNLFNVPVVAYSGEHDKQIQAARVMEEAFAKHGRKLSHLIGPGMDHRYHPDTLAEIAERMRRFATTGSDRHPRTVRFQTRTLRYNHCHWLELLALDEHWRDTRADAALETDQRLHVMTRNVAALKLRDPRTGHPGFEGGFTIEIDGQAIAVPSDSQPKMELILEKIDGRWGCVPSFPGRADPRKRPGLQGPIDDVFLEPFLVVVPTGTSPHPQAERWVRFELDHFLRRWRLLFRGDARVKRDVDVTASDAQRFHLILWGDPASNKVIERIADQLPIVWDRSAIRVGERTYPATDHVPSLIYPNPLAPSRYVVLNSGMTFREGHDHTNSLQNPKLPDWAVFDLNRAPDQFQAGGIADAGFFDESWRLRSQPSRPAAP